MPCERCADAGTTCEYSHSRHVSKDKLRAEIVQLKKALAVGQQQYPSPTPSSSQGPSDSDRSRDGDQAMGASGSEGASLPYAARAHLDSTTGQDCFQQLSSWRQCQPKVDGGHGDMDTDQSTILSFRPCDSSHEAEDRTDRWTSTGWTTAYVLYMFDVVFTWDYLPVCLLVKDHFLADYRSGSERYCSTALVCAILAISTRLVNEYADNDPVLPSGGMGSGFFCKEAQAIVRDGKEPTTLPDIQALGILSLYHLRCGRETEAGVLAEACASAITELCRRETASGETEEEKQYARVRATTYCGTMFLYRYGSALPQVDRSPFCENSESANRGF
jgi:hypothetical protein